MPACSSTDCTIWGGTTCIVVSVSVTCSSGAVALVGLIFTTGAPAGAAGPTVLLDGLSSPKGLTLDGNGNPVISQGALGPPGPTLRYNASGPARSSSSRVDRRPPSASPGPRPATRSGRSRQRASGRCYRPEPKVRPDGDRTPGDLRQREPGPVRHRGQPDRVEPVRHRGRRRNGDALVADAAANSVVRITKSGQTSLVARLAPEHVKTDHLPPDELPACRRDPGRGRRHLGRGGGQRHDLHR